MWVKVRVCKFFRRPCVSEMGRVWPLVWAASVWLNAGWAEENHVFLRYVPGDRAAMWLWGQPKCWGSLLCWVVHGRVLADPSPGLAICLQHEAFGVNDEEPDQAVLAAAMPKPLTFRVVVILACMKMCVSLSFLPFALKLSWNPGLGAGLIPWMGKSQTERLFWIRGRVILWLHR